MWQNNIKMDLIDTGWEAMEWTELEQDSGHWRNLVNMAMKSIEWLCDCRLLKKSSASGNEPVNYLYYIQQFSFWNKYMLLVYLLLHAAWYEFIIIL
jgi:hypothetical protein